jgi:hypothetical protein
MSKERVIQNEIRLALPGLGATGFRANVGQSWTGDEIIRLSNGDVVIKNARPFNTGLPNGFSDIFGLTNAGRFFAIEVKSPAGRPSQLQHHFLQFILDRGGLAGVARSVSDAKHILKGGGACGLSDTD